MPYSIGLAGKGGTGKTTISGLLIKYLVENGKIPVYLSGALLTMIRITRE